MGPLKLYYDFRDLFLAPRLALSGKKIWILIIGNLIGFINYWILSYLSIILNNTTLPAAVEKYGLYPSLFDNNASCNGLNKSVSNKFSLSCIIIAILSSPIPVSIFFLGNSSITSNGLS